MTPAQQRVYSAILDHWHRHAVPPSHRDLMAVTGIKSPNGVVANLKALRAKGYLTPKGTGIVPTKLAEHIRMFAGLLGGAK